MITEHIEGLGTFEFYDVYFIGRIAEGADAGADYVDALSELIAKHFSNRSPVYISDKVNSYSLDPMATSDLVSRNNIQYAGIVIYSQQQQETASYQARSIKGVTIQVFTDLTSAVNWAKQKAGDI